MIFSKLDELKVYCRSIDYESSLKTTLKAHTEDTYLILPFGLYLSLDVYQLKMDMVIEKYTGILGIADDIAIFGKTEEEHETNLHHLMKYARAGGHIFNKEKCNINKHLFGIIFK